MVYIKTCQRFKGWMYFRCVILYYFRHDNMPNLLGFKRTEYNALSLTNWKVPGLRYDGIRYCHCPSFSCYENNIVCLVHKCCLFFHSTSEVDFRPPMTPIKNEVIITAAAIGAVRVTSYRKTFLRLVSVHVTSHCAAQKNWRQCIPFSKVKRHE